MMRSRRVIIRLLVSAGIARTKRISSSSCIASPPLPETESTIGYENSALVLDRDGAFRAFQRRLGVLIAKCGGFDGPRAARRTPRDLRRRRRLEVEPALGVGGQNPKVLD